MAKALLGAAKRAENQRPIIVTLEILINLRLHKGDERHEHSIWFVQK